MEEERGKGREWPQRSHRNSELGLIGRNRWRRSERKPYEAPTLLLM